MPLYLNETPESIDALEEANKMALIPMGQLPYIAVGYLNFLIERNGFCSETAITAYAHYCQAVLKMPCADEEYKLTTQGKVWFDIHYFKK